MFSAIQFLLKRLLICSTFLLAFHQGAYARDGVITGPNKPLVNYSDFITHGNSGSSKGTLNILKPANCVWVDYAGGNKSLTCYYGKSSPITLECGVDQGNPCRVTDTLTKVSFDMPSLDIRSKQALNAIGQESLFARRTNPKNQALACILARNSIWPSPEDGLTFSSPTAETFAVCNYNVCNSSSCNCMNSGPSYSVEWVRNAQKSCGPGNNSFQYSYRVQQLSTDLVEAMFYSYGAH